MDYASTSASLNCPVEQSPPLPACESCNDGGALVYGTRTDDGIVMCAQCGAPLFYCDLGGQG